MRVIGVNGIRTHGAQNVDLLLGDLGRQGIPTHDVHLPRRHTLSARWGGRKDGRIIAAASSDGDVIVAHSFGCLRAWHAHHLRDYAAIICIAPAMERKAEWLHPERVYCWHSKSDWAIKIGSLLSFHPFGAAGNKGFLQSGVSNLRVSGVGHSDYFRDSMRKVILNHIVRTVLPAATNIVLTTRHLHER